MNIFWRSVSDMNVKAVVKYEYCLVYMLNENTNNNISHSIHSFWYRREIAFISFNKNGYSRIFYNGKNSCTFIPFILDISGEKANNSGNTISFM